MRNTASVEAILTTKVCTQTYYTTPLAYFERLSFIHRFM